MAAPCRRMASRPVIQFLSSFSKTTVRRTGFIQFFSSSACPVTSQTQHIVEKVTSPYSLVAAVCLQRLPVISTDNSPMEQQFQDLILQLEVENSVLSNHELQLLEDAETLRRKLADEYDSDEEDRHDGQDIMLAQDLEDFWEQKMKSFQLAPRVRADADKNLSSVERCLADPLVLLAQQQVGGQKMWLLPQTQWEEGETLRQTAERALASLPVAPLKTTFLGNAPCGVYKYKLPKALRTERSVGTKVFFFKAVVSSSSNSALTAPDQSVMWLKKSELELYLKVPYLTKVSRFILNL